MSGGLWRLPAGYKAKKPRLLGARNKHPERDFQTKVATFLSWALPPEVPWTAISHGIYVSSDPKQAARMGARLKAAGLKPGFPDIMLIWRGTVAFCELKAVGGSLSPAQREVHAKIKLAGGKVVICKTEDEVIAFLQSLGIPLQARLSPAERASARV